LPALDRLQSLIQGSLARNSYICPLMLECSAPSGTMGKAKEQSLWECRYYIGDDKLICGYCRIRSEIRKILPSPFPLRSPSRSDRALGFSVSFWHRCGRFQEADATPERCSCAPIVNRVSVDHSPDTPRDQVCRCQPTYFIFSILI